MSAERLFSALAAYPDNAPVLSGDNGSWRAAHLIRAIDELADRLTGCRSLAVLADNGPDWVIADLAALRAGIPHIPLPGFFSPAQLTHVLEQTGTDTVLTDQPERIAALTAGSVAGSAARFVIEGKWNSLVLLRRQAGNTRLPAGTAKVSFTSGSTGQPKGACLSAEGLLDTATAVARRLADLPIERHLAVLPLSLLLENTAGIHAPLLRGSAIHLPGLSLLGWQGMAGFDPSALQRTVATLEPDSLILVPELLKAWSLFLVASGQRAPAGLSYVAVGGARVERESLMRARALGLPAYQGYGLTECGSVVSLNRPGDDGDNVGRPLDHVSLRIEDGEIIIAARALLGYLGQDAAPSRTGGEFATGDLGHLDADGHLHLDGRRKNLLITSFGRNVSPEWVEAALLAQPEIAQAVVAGDGHPWLSGLLVPMPGIDGARLAGAVARANAALPDYARLGGWLAVEPFAAGNGEATGNGRPVRHAILARYAAAIAALHVGADSATPPAPPITLSDRHPAKEPDHVVL